MPAPFSTRRPRSLVCLGFVLAAVSACRAPSPDRPGAGAQLVGPLTLPQEPLETIARYEDARRDGDGLLQALLQRGDESTRARAAVALGRLPREEYGASVTTALVGALDDPAPRVRADAAFALGQRGDPAAAAQILAHGLDPDPVVRARLVEAASRIDEPRLRARVLAALDDADPLVRAEAAVGPSRFPPQLADARATDERLLAFLTRASAPERATTDAAARRGALFALARRKSESARDAFVAHLSSADVHERIHAAMGLGVVGASETAAKALIHALEDSDWRVACEAASALGKRPHPEAVAPLATATRHASAHVRRVAYEALASYGDQSSVVVPLLEHARVDPSASVRGAAIETGARILGAAAAPKLALSATEKDPVVRAATAAALAHVPAAEAVPLLDRLTRDPHLRVAGTAVESLGACATPEARARLCELLASEDNGLRLAAVGALAKTTGPADAPRLLACLKSAHGEISAELAAAIVDLAPKLGDGGREILAAGLAHPDPYVARKARALAAEHAPELARAAASERPARVSAVPIPGKDAPRWKKNPFVEVRTSRGVMVFELFPEEAPAHVFNFLALVDLHHYDGLDFHRVVPDFVVQGGDHRGDGNGGVTWRGDALRAEFTPRKYVRGSLGMPRNDDPDSGGSQFFVTHRETPHLDGRYTIFGELRSGFEVLDALEVGDVIVSVRPTTGP